MALLKNIILVQVLFSFFCLAQAKEVLVCKSVADDSHTIVLRSLAVGVYALSVYRSFHGHTFPPDRKDVYRDGASVADSIIFSDIYKQVKLTYNVKLKNSKGEFSGTFTDAYVNKKPVAVRCLP